MRVVSLLVLLGVAAGFGGVGHGSRACRPGELRASGPVFAPVGRSVRSHGLVFFLRIFEYQEGFLSNTLGCACAVVSLTNA
jgi:hypothetical protein